MPRVTPTAAHRLTRGFSGTPTQNVEPEFVGAEAWLYKQHRRIILPLLQVIT